MATIVASTSSTIVALLSTVDITAKAVSQTVGVIASSVDMLESYVNRAKDQQSKRHIVEDKDWLTNLIEDAAIARTERHMEITSKLDTAQLAVLNQHIAEYEALFVTDK